MIPDETSGSDSDVCFLVFFKVHYIGSRNQLTIFSGSGSKTPYMIFDSSSNVKVPDSEFLNFQNLMKHLMSSNRLEE